MSDMLKEKPEEHTGTGMLDEDDTTSTELEMRIEAERVEAEEAERADKVSDDDKTPVGTQEEDTKTDAGEESPDEEDTSQEADPVAAKFKELGFDKHYAGVIPMMEQTRGHITRLEQERADHLRIIQANQTNRPEAEKSKEITDEEFADQFNANPAAAIRGMGFVTRKEAETLAIERANSVSQSNLVTDRAERFRKETMDFNKHLPVMEEIYASMPGLKYAPLDEAMHVAYELAKARALPAAKPRVEDGDSTDPKKKTRANTSGGGARPKARQERTVEDWNNMPLSQMERELSEEAASGGSG